MKIIDLQAMKILSIHFMGFLRALISFLIRRDIRGMQNVEYCVGNA